MIHEFGMLSPDAPTRTSPPRFRGLRSESIPCIAAESIEPNAGEFASTSVIPGGGHKHFDGGGESLKAVRNIGKVKSRAGLISKRKLVEGIQLRGVVCCHDLHPFLARSAGRLPWAVKIPASVAGLRWELPSKPGSVRTVYRTPLTNATAFTASQRPSVGVSKAWIGEVRSVFRRPAALHVGHRIAPTRIRARLVSLARLCPPTRDSPAVFLL